MNKQLITIGIVDDHSLFRDGLVNLLAEHEHIKVIFEARNGLAMQDRLQGRLPDVILMDINMPGMNGHDATAWVKQNFPMVHVLALSMYEDDKSIIRMIRNGAGGYVLKESNIQELVKAITVICQAGHYVNELLSGRLMHSLREEDAGDKHVKLSPREIEFLQLCCSELTYKEIADAMKVSPRTVDGYRETLFQKLELKSRTGLVLYAIKNDLVDLENQRKQE